MTAVVKGFGRRPAARTVVRLRGRRSKASQGGNRGQEGRWRRSHDLWGFKIHGLSAPAIRRRADRAFAGFGCRTAVVAPPARSVLRLSWPLAWRSDSDLKQNSCALANGQRRGGAALQRGGRQPRENTHGQKEAGPAGDPAQTVQREAAPRGDHVNMRMMRQRRTPRMQNRYGADARAQVFRVGCDRHQRFGRRLYAHMPGIRNHQSHPQLRRGNLRAGREALR